MLEKNISKPSKKGCFVDETNKTSQAKSYSYKSNSNAKKVHVVMQAEVKRKMPECVKVGENVILSIQTKNQMEK